MLSLEVLFTIEADRGVQLALQSIQKLIGKDDVVWLPHVEIVIFRHVMEKSRTIA